MPESTRDKEKWTRADTISLFGAIINGIIAVGTIVALVIAIKSVNVSEKALAKSDTMNKKTLQIADSALGVQIDALKEAQREFDIASEPTIQIGNPEFKNLFVSDSEITVSVVIRNMGNYPVQLIAVDIGLEFDTVPPPRRHIYSIASEPSSAEDLIAGHGAVRVDNFMKAIKKEEYDAIRYYHEKPYILAHIKYQSTTNGNTYEYKYIGEVGNDLKGLTPSWNDNVRVIKK